MLRECLSDDVLVGLGLHWQTKCSSLLSCDTDLSVSQSSSHRVFNVLSKLSARSQFSLPQELKG